MRKIVLMILILLFTTSFCFAAGITEIGGGKVDSSGFSYTPITKTYQVEGTNTVTGQVVWTPASSNKIVLMGVSFSSEDKAEFTLETDVVLTGSDVKTATTVVPNTYCIASGIVVIGNGTPIWEGSADDILYLGTWSGAIAGNENPHSILLWGYEN